MKLIKLLTVVLTFSLLPNLPAQARREEACYSVDAKRGWQYLQLSGIYNRVSSIQGSWTVDSVALDRVGPDGYGAVEEYDGYLYDENLPLGALLIGVPGSPYTWLNEPQELTQSVRNVAMRINDNDLALTNNLGSLRVCFTN